MPGGTQAALNTQQVEIATAAVDEFSATARSLFARMESELTTLASQYRGSQAVSFANAKNKVYQNGLDISALTAVMRDRLQQSNVAYSQNDTESATTLNDNAVMSFEITSPIG